MSITRSFTLNTSLSDEALMAPFGDNVVTDGSNQATYIAGTKSLIGVYPLTVQYDWEYSFDVEHNTMVSIDIANETAPQTRRVLDDIVGPFIQTVGGEGWISHHDIPIVHWNSEVIRVDSSRYDTQRVVRSLETAGLDYQTAELWSEAEAEDGPCSSN